MSLTNLRDTDKVQLDIDINAFQKMQDAYCESAHVYATCFDTSFHSITRFSGSEEAKKFFGNFITQEMMQTLVASFGDNSIENIISFDTKEPYIFLSGVAIRDDEGSLIGVMLVPCIAKELLDTTLDELSFSEELEGGDTELEDSTLLEEYFSEELDATTELLLDSSLLLKMTSEEELLAGACDELDSTDDDETEDAAFHSMSSSGYFSPCFQAT